MTAVLPDYENNMENKISNELKAWLTAERGRSAALARHLDVSRMLVTRWARGLNGISASAKKGYHKKIFEFAGVRAVEKTD